jgi:sugar phosphate permease
MIRKNKDPSPMKQTVAVSSEAANFRFELVRWSTFVILMLTYILVYFHRMAPGVVSEFLMADFRISGTRLGALSAIYFAVYALMQIPSGVIADTLGTRTSIISGNLVAGLGSILFGIATGFETACAGRFLVGLGVSVVFIAIMKNNAVWFHERVFGILSGLTLFFGNLGAIMAAGPLAQVLTVFHWRTVFIGIGLLSLCLALIGFLLVRNKPQDMGFTPPNTYTGQSQAIKNNWLANLRSVVMTLRVWPGFWVQFGMIGSSYTFMGLWGMPYLRDVHNLNRSFAADHMTIQLLSFALGALFWGWISDKIGKRKPFLISAAAAYVLSWIILMYLPWTSGNCRFRHLCLYGILSIRLCHHFCRSQRDCPPTAFRHGGQRCQHGLFHRHGPGPASIRIYCGFDLGWYHSKRCPDIQLRRLPERVHCYDPFIDSCPGSSFQG